jgi:transcriptional regulator
MYVPKAFEETDRSVLHDLIATHPLGAWVIGGESGLVANHIPFEIDRDRGELGTLVAHVAKANPVWRSAAQSESIVIFQGPESYISPSWYATKARDGMVVPTWNYAVVHAHGSARVIHDEAWLHALVARLTARHESAERRPWQVSDAPADFIAKLVKTIVGIEIPIARLEGKWKTSQNRPDDTRGIAAGLRQRRDTDADAMAKLVEERRPRRD